ncbi:anti-repressor SinI family protein [Cytobacillus purgationiresistens]|uniref:anti-repressor SinI family protein n=1 Tax=Cytobacillus purgationiresistens TaxID=863449 RepID=UPI0027D90036|nr:anti-repressor SinI family protein [Cytobacillus purgationiresistens]
MKLDNEWVELVIEAKKIGISITDIREFFKGKIHQNTEMIALCTTFNKNEHGYKEWCEQNSNGFVFNHFRNTDSAKQMNKIHRANCYSLKVAKDEGKRTYPYEKSVPRI